MAKKHDWSKEQPHHVVSGRITSARYALANPKKVEWVSMKKHRRK